MSKKFSAKFSAVVAALAIALTGLTAMPANATASTAKQPAKTVTLGSDFDENGNGRVVVVGGWAYSLQGFSDSSFWGTPSEASSIKRTKVSTFGTGTPVTILGQSDDDASREVSTVGGTVTKLWRPVSMDVVGNSIFVLDLNYEDETSKLDRYRDRNHRQRARLRSHRLRQREDPCSRFRDRALHVKLV